MSLKFCAALFTLGSSYPTRVGSRACTSSSRRLSLTMACSTSSTIVKTFSSMIST